ncbi:ATP-binding cassette domain-containing protein [Streptomyces sp. NPDC102274]|uniref:ATP-binding cassette domain-containing protein n=1 Tax=Streptomyces sp. NPDC102274 TaxID=3366151 RepID=UPI0038199477
MTAAVHSLTVRHRRTIALDTVDLGFGTGVHGLLGPNDAGKTSLIRVLATVAAPAGGRVELLGDDVAEHRARAAVRRRLGYLPQEFGYYPGFTVRESHPVSRCRPLLTPTRCRSHDTAAPHPPAAHRPRPLRPFRGPPGHLGRAHRHRRDRQAARQPSGPGPYSPDRRPARG